MRGYHQITEKTLYIDNSGSQWNSNSSFLKIVEWEREIQKVLQLEVLD